MQAKTNLLREFRRWTRTVSRPVDLAIKPELSLCCCTVANGDIHVPRHQENREGLFTGTQRNVFTGAGGFQYHVRSAPKRGDCAFGGLCLVILQHGTGVFVGTIQPGVDTITGAFVTEFLHVWGQWWLFWVQWWPCLVRVLPGADPAATD